MKNAGSPWPPKPTWLPKPRQLPERKRMTIALGMLIPDTTDLVIAADTQETYQDAKIESQKIMSLSIVSRSEKPIGCVVFSGAGAAGHLDSLGQAVLKTFLDSDDLTGESLKVEFEKTIRQFYRRHVIPFGETWVRNEQLAVSTLIAYQRGKGAHGLFSNTLTAVKETPCIAVGTGQVVAISLLNRLRQSGMSCESALRLAAYAIYQAKEHDPFCGKKTHLVLISGNRSQSVPAKVIQQWEQSFQRMERTQTATMAISLGIGIGHEIAKVMGHTGRRKLPKFDPSGILPAPKPGQ
jgi:20S proteasome alpha/beta subunit